MHSLYFCLKHLSAPEAIHGPGQPRIPQQMKGGQVQLKIIQARIALALQRKSPCPCALSHPAGNRCVVGMARTDWQLELEFWKDSH